jgi:two-component system response regulator NreC
MEAQALSARESTVLHCVVWGFSNKEIAGFLSLSVKTVEAHKANGMRKLAMRGRPALVRFAVEEGWLTMDAYPPAAAAVRN